MTATCLPPIFVEKPWGRRDLGAGFGDVAASKAPVGEIWFAGPPGERLPLMIKYLFTSERLSVQVHPDDAQARARGYPHGKDECWLVLAADPGATIGLGLREQLGSDALREAALNGSIEALLDWRTVAVGDLVYLAAGTIHAIGAGLTLIEVQQNLDLTYRLYDYGRPRDLQLDEGMAVARGGRFVETGEEQRKFRIQRTSIAGSQRVAPLPGSVLWCVAISGYGMIDGQSFAPGQCWLVRGDATIEADSADMLFASPAAIPL